MAKGRSIHLGPKNFFTLVVLSVTTLGLMFVTYASQQKTNTQSDAAGGCIMTPQVKYVSGESWGDFGVKYTLRVWNDSPIRCDKVLKYVSINTAPQGWQMMYKNHIDESTLSSYFFFGDLVPQQKHTVRLEVIPPQNIKNGTYNLPIRVCRTFPVSCKEAWCGNDGRDWGERYRIGATDSCSRTVLKYVKD